MLQVAVATPDHQPLLTQMIWARILRPCPAGKPMQPNAPDITRANNGDLG